MGTLVAMQLDDTLAFHVPRQTLAHQLAARLRSAWVAWSEPGDAGWGVFVELRPNAEDLARLLREVAAWAVENSLSSVAFELDGRVYTVVAAAPVPVASSA